VQLTQIESQLLDTLSLVARVGFPYCVFDAIAVVAAKEFQPILFSITARMGETMMLERAYSSLSSSYAPGGRKDKTNTVFGRRVLCEGLQLRSEGVAAIRAHFEDAEKIIALGGKSQLNVPVLCNGKVIGVLNATFAADSIDESAAAILSSFAPLAAVALLGRDDTNRLSAGG